LKQSVSSQAGKILVKRVYEPAAKADGFRVLVDRIWPRGLSKEAMKLDLWLPDLGPSTKLRQWFNHDPVRWDEFQRRYHAELKDQQEPVAELKGRIKQGTVTLLYSAKDEQHNQAVALRSFLLDPPGSQNRIMRPSATISRSRIR
jgi:uncharacterized protein YeaO (DUF488 family)